MTGNSFPPPAGPSPAGGHYVSSSQVHTDAAGNATFSFPAAGSEQVKTAGLGDFPIPPSFASVAPGATIRWTAGALPGVAAMPELPEEMSEFSNGAKTPYPAPTVDALYVNGSRWSQSFRDALAAADEGSARFGLHTVWTASPRIITPPTFSGIEPEASTTTAPSITAAFFGESRIA